MPDPLPASVARLPALALLDITGEHAPSFLHAQLSNDVANLAPGHTLLAAHCTAQGRVSTLLRLWHIPGGLRALLPADQLDATVKRLRLFVLRARVELNPRPDLAVLGWIGAAPAAADPGVAQTSDGVRWLRMPGTPPRFAMVATSDALRTLPWAVPHGTDTDAWELGEIQAGLAQVWAATRDVFLPHHLNLDLTDGVSFRKGCYPGQEIVARMHYRGRPTRRMLRASAPCPPPAPGAAIWAASQDQPQGQVVRAVATRAGCELLAVVQTNARGTALHLGTAGGPPLQIETLPYAIPEWDAGVDNPPSGQAP